MDALVDYLQKNAYAIVILTAVGLLGTVVTIVTGWESFLVRINKEVTLPAWVWAVFLVVAVTAYITKSTTPKQLMPSELPKVSGVIFGNEQVELDGKRFERCVFNRSELIYSGRQGTALQGCELNQPKFLYVGPAGNAIGFISLLYKDPGTRTQIESLFEQIKAGNILIENAGSKIDNSKFF